MALVVAVMLFRFITIFGQLRSVIGSKTVDLVKLVHNFNFIIYYIQISVPFFSKLLLLEHTLHQLWLQFSLILLSGLRAR